MNDMKDYGPRERFTLNESIDDFGMIEIATLNPDLEDKPKPAGITHIEVPRPPKRNKPKDLSALDNWAAAQAKRRHSNWPLMIVVLALALTFVLWLNIAHAADAVLKFHVVKVTKEVITVVDENGDGFTFFNDPTLHAKVGETAWVVSNLTYKGDSWHWKRSTTKLMETKKEDKE